MQHNTINIIHHPNTTISQAHNIRLLQSRLLPDARNFMTASVPWLVMSLLGYVRVAVSSVRLFRPCSRPSQEGSAESLELADRFRVFSLVSPAAKYNTAWVICIPNQVKQRHKGCGTQFTHFSHHSTFEGLRKFLEGVAGQVESLKILQVPK